MRLKFSNVPDNKFNKAQLRMGVKVEMEHVYKASDAKKIAKAHLMEFPNYYTALNKMEKSLAKHMKRKK